MGSTQGKLAPRESLKVMQDFSETSGLSLNDVKRHYEEWKEQNPKGMMSKANFKENLSRLNPSVSKADINKIGDHAFRVYDTNKDGKISFQEFMVVYNVMAWTDPDTILRKIFHMFDIDNNNVISKSEMKSVLTDLSVLFNDTSASDGKKLHEKVFEEMDKNGDKFVTKDEFVSIILNNSQLSQGLSIKILDLFLE